jgi:hypothetical protein
MLTPSQKVSSLPIQIPANKHNKKTIKFSASSIFRDSGQGTSVNIHHEIRFYFISKKNKIIFFRVQEITSRISPKTNNHGRLLNKNN